MYVPYIENIFNRPINRSIAIINDYINGLYEKIFVQSE